MPVKITCDSSLPKAVYRSIFIGTPGTDVLALNLVMQSFPIFMRQSAQTFSSTFKLAINNEA